MEFRFKSIKTVIYRVLRDFGIGDKEIAWQDYCEWGIEALQLIDAYTQYIERYEFPITIENNMAKLPDDFYSAMANPGLAYKIQDDSIVTEKKNGEIKLNYLALPFDEEGFLLIPDNISYDEAIKWRIGMMLSIRGELNNPVLNLQYCEAKWNFYCRQARSKSNMLDAESLERFAQNRLRFKLDTNQYATGFHRVVNKLNRKYK